MATTKKPAEEPIKETKAPEEDDRVLIMIPYVEGEDPEVTVGINGVFTKIQRGRSVRVTKAVAEVLENSSVQAMQAIENQKKFKQQVTEM